MRFPQAKQTAKRQDRAAVGSPRPLPARGHLVEEISILEEGENCEIAAHTERHEPLMPVFRPLEETEPAEVVQHG